MTVAALPTSNHLSPSPPTRAPEQEADVLIKSSVLLRPPHPRHARASSRPTSLVIIVSAAEFACHRPRSDTHQPSAILKSP